MNPVELLSGNSSWSNSYRSSPAYTEYVHRELFHVRKFDLVLHHEDGTEYDGNGCFSCFLGCKKPVYPAGQHITGYLLIRPMRRLVITGVAVTFSGQFVTSWQEECLHWGSQQIFYREKVIVIENRRIDLDCKWYRFDFEYVLPHGLPSSFKEPEAKLVYFATGSVFQPEGPEIETFDTHFHIQGIVDIDVFPSLWHEPTERRLAKIYPVGHNTCSISNENLCQVVGNHSVVINEGGSDGETHVMCSGMEDDPQLFAILWINSQAFVIGEQVTADVKVENHTHHPVECALKIEQVIHMQASLAREDKGRREPPVYHFRKHRKKNYKEINTLWSTRVNAHSNETVSRIFHVPTLVPTMPQDFRHLPYPGGARLRELAGQRDPGIFIQYFITLVLTPQWDGAEEIHIPVEIKVGSKDTATRFTRSPEEDAMTDTTENMERWDVPPSIEDAPPSYDEYFSAKPSCSRIIENHMDDIETIETEDTHFEDTIGSVNAISHTPLDTHSELSDRSPGMIIISPAPFASHDPSPDDVSSSESISLLSSNRVIQNPMFTSLEPVELPPLAEQVPPPPPDNEETGVHSPTDTMSSSAHGPQLLCNGAASVHREQPQQMLYDVDNLSGHFTDISLSSPQDSIAGVHGSVSSERMSAALVGDGGQDVGRKSTELVCLITST